MLVAYQSKDSQGKIYDLNRFILLPRHIVRQYDAPTAMVVGALLYFGGKNGKCYPAQKVIGKFLGMDNNAVSRVINKLRDDKLISTTRTLRGKFNYSFIWNKQWERCFTDTRNIPVNKNGNPICTGSKFNPYKLFDCTVLPLSVAEMVDVRPMEKVLYAYMISKMGSSGYFWEGQRKIAKALGVTYPTVSAALKKLTSVEAIFKETENMRGHSHTYTAVLHNFLLNDMTYKKQSKLSSKLRRKLDGLLGNNKENPKREPCSFLDKSKKEPLQVETTGAKSTHGPAEVVVSLTELVSMLPKQYYENVKSWLAEIPTSLPESVRISIWLRMVHSKGIKNKAAYVSTLVRKALEGGYVTAGINSAIHKFVNYAYSVCRDAGYQVGISPFVKFSR